MSSSALFKENLNPEIPSIGYVRVFLNASDKKIYQLDENGLQFKLTPSDFYVDPVINFIDVSQSVPLYSAGDRYIVQNANSIDPTWGNITGLEENDIIERNVTDTNWVIATDVSALKAGIAVYISDDFIYKVWNNIIWSDLTFSGVINSSTPNQYNDLVDEKLSIVNSDLFLIEDSEDTFYKKSLSYQTLYNIIINGVIRSTQNQFPTLFSNKITPVNNDILLIEDSEDSNNKKNLLLGDLRNYVLTNVFRLDISNQKSSISEKTNIVDADVIIIEDSETSYNKKFVQRINFLSGVIRNVLDQFGTLFSNKVTPVDNDRILIEDSAASNGKKYSTIGQILTGVFRNISNQFGSLTQKSTLVSADRLLIEDSESSYSKKYALLSDVRPIFGTQFQQVTNLTLIESTIVTLTTHNSLTTPVIPAGTYRIGWKFNWNYTDGGSSFISELRVDGVQKEYFQSRPVNNQDIQSFLNSGFFYITLTNAVHTIDIRFASESNGRTSRMWNNYIDIWRVS